jgi:hypothetical protein
MDEDTPTLSDVARSIYWEEGLDIDETRISEGLRRAGLDEHDQRERQRLRLLVIAENRVKREDALCKDMAEVGEFLDDAREMLEPREDIRLVIQLARELKADVESQME